jgi:hypothetical protein
MLRVGVCQAVYIVLYRFRRRRRYFVELDLGVLDDQRTIRDIDGLSYAHQRQKRHLLHGG